MIKSELFKLFFKRQKSSERVPTDHHLVTQKNMFSKLDVCPVSDLCFTMILGLDLFIRRFMVLSPAVVGLDTPVCSDHLKHV